MAAVGEVPTVDVRELIGVDEANAADLRASFVARVWPGGLPATLPDDDLVVRLPYGVDSHLQLLEPEAPRCAVIVWHGHSAVTPGVDAFAAAARDRECVVVVGWMPLFGPNPRLTNVATARGPVTLARHDPLSMLEGGGFSALRLFLEPVAAAVNLIEERWPSLPVSMVGLSGGGWTTTAYAALDERIRLSIPVAGTLPEFLRTLSSEDWGDFEQHHPDQPATLDQYVLGTTDGRRQVQVLIDGDPCCFNAAGGRHETYEAAVDEVAGSMAGRFEVLTFVQDVHAIGPEMSDALLELVS